MDVAEACRVTRQAFEFSERGGKLAPNMEVHDAVLALKAHLERLRGRAIPELRISDELLSTRHGLRYLMPFVVSAEAPE